MRLVLAVLLALLAGRAWAQTSPSCAQLPHLTCADAADTITGAWTLNNVNNITGGTLRLPNATSAPGTCTVGDFFFDNDAAQGSRLKLCTATDTFTNIDENGSAGSHAILSATHTDSTASTVTRGDLIVGTGASPTWDDLAIGAANTVLGSDGTDATWTAISSSHIGAGDLANALTWNESCTASPCTLANAPRAADTALVVHQTLTLRRVTSCGGVNEYTLSGTTLTFCGDAPAAAPANALVTYER